MKNSSLVGAAETAPVQSTDNSPCGYTKPPKGSKSPMKEVAYSNTDRAKKGSPQFDHAIGGK